MLLGKKMENRNHGKLFLYVAYKEIVENSGLRSSHDFKWSNLHN